MSRSPSAGAMQTAARTFAAGAAFGFLTGAFVVCIVVWQFGNIIGSRAAAGEFPAAVPDAVERWSHGVDDAGAGVLEGAGPPVPTSRDEPSPVSVPPPPVEPVLRPEPSAELADRDLAIPVEGITADKLTRSFSDNRGGGRVHQAIDILAPRNTPVKAVDGGRIARLFFSKAGGITIYQFDPSERFCYYYAHLERYADGLQEGQEVRKGQVIGYVGVSGNAPKETPHLHFAVFRLTAQKRWWEGTPVDPYDLLR